MTERTTRTTRTAVACLLAGLLVLAAVATAGTGTAAAQQEPETANEYFETFRSMEGEEAYQEYEEFETIRTFAVSRAQEVGTLDSDDRAEFAAVLNAMVAFEEAYELSAAGDYEESLAAAEEAEAAIDELESYEETQATLADLAVTRFYASLGDGLREQASSTERVPDRVELLSMTATAYERANQPNEASEFNLRAERLSAEYDAAVERMDAAEATAGSFLDRCLDCGTVAGAVGSSANPVQTFTRYQASQEALSGVRDAQSDARANGLEQRTNELRALAGDVSDARFSLGVASASILVGYGLVVGLVSTAVIGRIFLWRRTYDMAQIGSVVSGGEGGA
jgi:tetratricopeptide (TPR) repeat protein